MTYAPIREALETHLSALEPALDTEWEGVGFDAPDGEPWQRAFVRFAPPLNRETGRRAIVSGFLQVTLCFPFGEGPGAAEARADLLAEHFARGAPMQASGGQVVTVSNTPEVMAGEREGGLWVVPVRIPFHAHTN